MVLDQWWEKLFSKPSNSLILMVIDALIAICLIHVHLV
jgi:hypothetical protein